MTLSFVSLFAGIGGFDRGFHMAGFEPRGMCEIDPHAQSVLRRHWPNVPLHDDVTTLTVDTFGPADVVTFGSPCQDLSVAGKRAGLDGERSGLFLEAVRYIRDMLRETNGRSPRFAVWENVPGAYSSNGGRDFAAVLQALVGGEVRRPANGWANAGVAFGPLGCAEWRTLDSQHFGVAQRRRRVFVVYRPGGERAGEVLLEPAGVPGHPPKGRAPGQGITGALTGGAGSSSAGNPDDNRAQAGFLIPEVMPTMRAGGANDTPSKGQVSGDMRDEYIVPVLGISQELDAEEELLGTLKRDSPTGGGSRPMVAVAPTVTASWGHHGHSSPRGDGTDPIVPVAIAPTGTHPTLNAAHGGKDAGPAGLVPVAFALRGREDGATPEVSGDRSRDMVAYAATDYSTGSFAQTEHAGPLTATEDRTRAGIITNPVTYAVRRLTPRECERLQAFPDDHTRYDHHGREIADTHRYRMLGNAVTVTVANWIAHRIRQAA